MLLAMGSNWRIRALHDSIDLISTLIKLAQVIYWAKTSAPVALSVSKCSPVCLLKRKFRPGGVVPGPDVAVYPLPSERLIDGARTAPLFGTLKDANQTPTPMP
jgi:hypothetical protein